MSEAMITKHPISKRTQAVKFVLWAVLFLNLGVAAAKYLFGWFSGSASMQADGIHSFFDSAGNVVGLIGIAVAARPADESHPYGHAKFETYGSLVIGVLLLFAAFEVGSTAVGKLISGEYTAEVGPFSFVVMLVTLAVNLCVTYFERRAGKKYKSEILVADASHTLSDALVSVGVIVGLILVSFGFPMADPIMALVVTVAILFTAIDVFKHGLATLSDHSRIPEEALAALVKQIEGVQDAHRIRTRGTEGEVYVDLHVLVEPAMKVVDAHALADRVEHTVMDAYPSVADVLVHIEPNDGHED